MAKKTVNLAYQNGVISKDENGNFIITEVTKDEMKNYNLSKVLDDLEGEDNVSIAIKNTAEIGAE